MEHLLHVGHFVTELIEHWNHLHHAVKHAALLLSVAVGR